MELNEKLYNQIVKLSEEGDCLVDEENLDAAIEKYQTALELLPEPIHIWEASTWLYTALGDTCYLKEQYEQALGYLYETLKCPGGLENPFVFLRIGECFYEMKNIKKAQEFLLQAYMYAGETIFEDEPQKFYDEIEKFIVGGKGDGIC